MATQIKLKRGLEANTAGLTLAAGEPAFTTDTGKLYVGNGSDKVLINPINIIPDIDITKDYTKVQVNQYGQVVKLDSLVESDIPTLPNTKISGLGSASTYNAGSQSGELPVLDANGKISASMLPSLAITNTFVVVSAAEMTALTAEVGDVAIRTDIDETYILKAIPATEITNWVKLLSPSDAVTSVNGKIGAVTLNTNEFLLPGYMKAANYSEIIATDNIEVAIGKLEKNFDNFTSNSSLSTTLESYAAINSPSFTGTPVAVTPVTTDSSNKIATTEFVKNAIAAVIVLDGGTF